MMCTLVQDVYRATDAREVGDALERLVSDSADWSPKGVYCYWDPDRREALYVGLASDLKERFEQHNGLVRHTGGNKQRQISKWFAEHEALGLSVVLQSAAVVVLEALDRASPMLGAQPRDVVAVGEGQLIELHRLAYGHLPPWNDKAGSSLGQRWASLTDHSMIHILTAAQPSLFVARRSIRSLAEDNQALRFEAAIHSARMRAVMESHHVGDYEGLKQTFVMEHILKLLMVRDGHLVDDLSASDQQITSWVQRLSDPDERSTEAEAALMELFNLQEDTDVRDDVALEFIAYLLEGGSETDEPEILTEVLASGYLREDSPVPI